VKRLIITSVIFLACITLTGQGYIFELLKTDRAIDLVLLEMQAASTQHNNFYLPLIKERLEVDIDFLEDHANFVEAWYKVQEDFDDWRRLYYDGIVMDAPYEEYDIKYAHTKVMFAFNELLARIRPLEGYEEDVALSRIRASIRRTRDLFDDYFRPGGILSM